MKKILSKFVLATTCLLSSATINAEPASTESIKSMMELTQSSNVGVQILNQLAPAIKKMIPDASEEFWVKVAKDINPNEFQDLIIPVYKKYLTEEDIVAITHFYNTPSGKKLIKVQPNIMQESYKIGQEWGQGVAKEIVATYKNEHKDESKSETKP